MNRETMLELEEAVRILTSSTTSIKETEDLSLDQAAGRVLASDIRAAYDQPPFPRSPLDGYAVRGEDIKTASKEEPVVLTVIGKIFAGQVFTGTVGDGECVRLMTGSPIPRGADTVVRQEDTWQETSLDKEGQACQERGQPKADTIRKNRSQGEVGSRVAILRPSAPYQNYCYAGEDYQRGDVLVQKGMILTGIRLGIIAGSGRDRVTVYREPAITVLSTGDEVLAPGQKMTPGKIYDSNRFTVVGRLADLGFTRVRSYHCGDDPDLACQRIREAALTSDLVITTGGVSVGEKDIMHQVMEDLEGEKLFWTVRVKPGAPTLAFRTGGIPVICLTGNPYGVAVNFELLVRPVLAKLAHKLHIASRTTLCRLKNDSPKHGGIRRFMRGYMADNESEVRILTGSHASGTLASMAESNCLVEIPEDGKGQAGDLVKVYQL